MNIFKKGALILRSIDLVLVFSLKVELSMLIFFEPAIIHFEILVVQNPRRRAQAGLRG